MNNSKPERRAYAWPAWAAGALAALVGLKYGFEFGEQVAGFWLGLLMGLNGSVFCGLMASATVNRLIHRRTQRDQDLG
jgi:hypothetical protein